MSNNYLQVKSSSTIGVSSNFVPDVTDSFWEFGSTTNLDWQAPEGDNLGQPYTIGVRPGNTIVLTDPLASGPNHGAKLTMVSVSGTFPDTVVNVLETLSSPDSTDYEFRIEKSRPKYCIDEVTLGSGPPPIE